MKKLYESPELAVIYLHGDVLTASDGTVTDPENQSGSDNESGY